ncbi:isochorismate synthase [Ancylobacter lacus]|uniref:isochorismate synthase n=1 Tax=Ancylobacter lacus TaxID=2579970 RepID=UPI001BCF9D64|nr:isochorismate synthase [Ancylobacter lacus]MBS7539015.1 isochorismate synthase [Ancylobacter lacus]
MNHQPARSDAPSSRPAPEVALAPSFVLRGAREALAAQGCRRSLPAAGGTLEDRLARFFAQNGGGPGLLVGALPYEATAPAHLYEPATLARPATPAATEAARHPPAPALGACRATPRPDVAGYRAAVAAALARMADEAHDPAGLRKIVLARALWLETEHPIDAAALLDRLARDPAVTAFRVPLPAAGADAAPRELVGATPELLLAKSGARVASHPLAGSARRRPDDPAADADAARALLASAKDRREHAAVAEAVLDELAPLCRTLGTPEGTTLFATASMWHLGTRIAGELKDPGLPSLVLAARLHPTPAVCGAPRAAAARAIAQLEPAPRGFYSGAVGWCDAAGDGRWWVAIRCAEIAGRTARLYAGAGIVPGSDPEAEAEETAAKFAALLDALGVDETGRLRAGEPLP